VTTVDAYIVRKPKGLHRLAMRALYIGAEGIEIMGGGISRLDSRYDCLIDPLWRLWSLEEAALQRMVIGFTFPLERRMEARRALSDGYWWAPCPICLAPFGGHELSDDSKKPINHERASIPSRFGNHVNPVCPVCYQDGSALPYWRK
jgi:hypothetical protein